MECAAFDERFLAALNVAANLNARLPAEARAIIESPCDSNVYLETLSRLAIHPVFSSTMLACYAPLFPELVARWPTFASPAQMAVGFGGVLPVVPYLVEVTEHLLLAHPDRKKSIWAEFRLTAAPTPEEVCSVVRVGSAMEILLSLHRLLCFKRDAFIPLIDTVTLYHLLHHSHRAVRYMVVRILCIYLKAADAAQDEMLDKYGVGRHSETVLGPWQGREVDYGFLISLESRRFQEMADALEKARVDLLAIPDTKVSRVINSSDLSPMTADLCGVLIPRSRGVPSSPVEIVDTATTRTNIRSLALALRTSQPVLVTGQAGSGKTFFVHQIARTLNALDTMVSIHLSGQTDAKLLIGTYTTADTPGSFEWRPGVLATAVREGRWVLVEDIDKAPTEVLSVLLPLIERGELDIPSRGQKIKAARGFRLITTARTTPSNSHDVSTPNLLGSRLWVRANVEMPAESELQTIVNSVHPLLHPISPSILSSYTTIQKLYREPSFFAISRTSLGRRISPRDLFKWCSRINALFISAGVKAGAEVLPDGLYDEIFNEAVDCFAGSLQTLEARRLVAGRIAEDLQIPSQRVDLLMEGHIPTFKDSERMLVVGRAKLQKQKDPTTLKRRKKSLGTEKRPFATTNHALRLLEQVGVAVRLAEPVLLVGETGTGKTTVVQQLADMLGYNLTAINLSQQTESGDLLGGYKPVDARSLAVPLKETFDDLFEKTFSLKKNKRFLDVLTKCWNKQQWKRIIILWGEAIKMAENFFATPEAAEDQPEQQKKKKRKLDGMDKPALQAAWARFSHDLANLERQSSQLSKSFAFSFVEGSLVKAARNGDWVLLDEINLAAPDTLESIADLLKDGGGGSILLSEKGDVERIQAHPNFRIFACMNPATDVGKRDLPSGLRSRFTELYVASPDSDFGNLLAIVNEYIGHLATRDERVCADVAQLYLEAKKLADSNRLVDGASQKPHFSMRTLTRTLSYVLEIVSVYGLRRSLYEGFCMGFLTLLDKPSEMILLPIIDKFILASQKNVRSMINQIPKPPTDGQEYVQFKHYWMRKGPYEPEEQPHYIITPFVERNMLNLVRATATRRFPVLIQGPTSAGKTSMIEYLARRTGHKFVRINNHEHTDLQEYLGSYVSDNDGRLHFLEGILVDALRKGHWIVLDELNLAPTDVLEALNRLLDDNRELLIPETHEIVRPHKDFMLFATQNPPGLYGGRKNLSRAFRNRFLELHFDDIPESELGTILKERCQIAPSYGDKIVKVYKELSLLRQSTRLFEQKNSFATLRDLFRWANRDANGYQQLAEDGYMLLAERVRKEEEKLAVQKVLEKEMKVKIDVSALYTAERIPEYSLYMEKVANGPVVWTKAMKRLFSLVAHALRNNEPVLLVGETGCGKTTVCQMLAEAFGKRLIIVNAHQNTETGDIIGAQRPIRNRSAYQSQLTEDLLIVLKEYAEPPQLEGIESSDLAALLKVYSSLPVGIKDSLSPELLKRIELNRTRSKALFEWAEGPLVQAMKEREFFLLDEISLADDSVLERLNSVLEPARGILLAEKGPEEGEVRAADGFQFLATMNPGGDYGKKELSPALRNRFTEIWVPAMTDYEDVVQIVSSSLRPEFAPYAEPIVRYAQWFSQTYNFSSAAPISIRNVLAWTRFVNLHAEQGLAFGLLHGAALVFFDSLGANPSALLTLNADSLVVEKQRCLKKLSELVDQDLVSSYTETVTATADQSHLRLGPFALERKESAAENFSFSLEAPTTAMNAMRVIRAMQLRKPILLEGSPGVGKTSLITALANASGNPLTRINLSDQTDLMDLFGSDVPVEGGQRGEFAWRDAPFLRAMQKGDWVLLDEMNLASQSVLEGLNACLDHRGEVYISELDRTFSCHPNFLVFAAQNPHHQGGGRKGLPTSFVNRFTVVYVDQLSFLDLQLIARKMFSNIPQDMVDRLISFVVKLDQQLQVKRSFGALGGPWEFNLRDTLRWLQLLATNAGLLASRPPEDFLDMVVKQRFRTADDQKRVDQIFVEVFGYSPPSRHLYHRLSTRAFQVGHALVDRRPIFQPTPAEGITVLKSQLRVLETIMSCVQQNTPCLLVGASGTGKSSMIKLLAAITGAELDQLALNADVDTTDIVGGFEQVDLSRKVSALFKEIRQFLYMGVIDAIRRADAVDIDILKLVEFLATSGLAPDIETLHGLLLKAADTPSGGAFERFLKQAGELAAEARQDTTARFEWVDGMLIKAIEDGKWLVLDNANLCSPSVLDRLNSLLETNGFLVVNEHSTANGDPKLVKPHPEFRLFITMDPKHGELSRAMRNRCVEVFVDHSPLHDVAAQDDLERKDLASFVEASGVQSDTSVFQLVEQVLKTPAQQDTYPQVVRTMLENIPRDILPLLNRWKSYVVDSSADEVARLQLITDAVDQSIRFAAHPVVQNVGTELIRSVCGRLQLAPEFIGEQPVIPMRNEGLFASCGRQEFVALSEYYDVARDILDIHGVEEGILQKSTAVKFAEMNFLERSASRRGKKMPAFGGTVGVQLFEFLANLRKILEQWLNDSSVQGVNQNGLGPVREAIELWRDLVQLSSTTDLNESVFHVYLALFEIWIRNAEQGLPQQYVKATETALSTFREPLQLVTGLSMEIMWSVIRPSVPNSLAAWEQYLALKAIMARFDKVGIEGSLDTVLKLKESLVEAVTAVLSDSIDVSTLVQDLHASIRPLEKAGSEQMAGSFNAIFDLLLKFKMLRNVTGSLPLTRDNLRMAHFAKRAAENLIGYDLPGVSLNVSFERVVADIWTYPTMDATARGPNGLLTGKIAAEMLRTSHTAKETVISQLQALEIEIKELSKQFTLHTPEITSDRVQQLNFLLRSKVKQLLVIHKDAFKEAQYGSAIQGFENGSLDALREVLASTDVEYLQAIVHEHLLPVVDSLLEIPTLPHYDSIVISGKAWVHYALACLKLYVPNVAFDPAMKPMVKRQRHLARKFEITTKIEAEKLFELHFTGQTSSQRVQTLQNRLIGLGEEPPNSLIARPVKSEMSSLQGDLSNVLRVVVDSEPHHRLLDSILRRSENYEQQAALFQTNLSQLVERLEMGHPVYKDMTDPVVGFLYYLKLGLSLAAMTPETSLGAEGTKSFLAPHESAAELPQMPPKVEQEAQMLWLRQYAARSTTEGYENLDSSTREKIHSIFQRLFKKWKAETEEEKEKAIAESRTYQYRGETEDHDEQEFKQMFPDYQGDDTAEENKEPKLSDHKQTAIRLAQVQSALLTASTDSLSVLIREGASVWMKAAGDNTSTFSPEKIEEFLPAIFLSLKDTTSWVSGAQNLTKKYDFYNDENLAQAHHVVSIVKKIHKRMSGLLEMWPENVTLQDAVEACQGLFLFPAATPVAKFLSKVEKIHSILNEWQSVASREYSAAEHYDALTQLIISWRRLELTTWPRLFDLEDEKQKELALSWWFFVYESVIANPLELLAEDLKKHVQQLVASLVEFVTSSSLGQFPHRLQLIRVFELHVSRLCVDFVEMELVRDSLRAFILYYAQYESAAKEALKRERKTVEKAVADVVLLASWKDTNIVALRESAKRSHHKLYKVVRKYRQLLNTSAMGVISAGMSNEDKAAVSSAAVSLGKTDIDTALVQKVYEDNVKAWEARPPRLRDLPGALGMMQRVSKVPESKLDVAHFLERFSTSIITTVKELQAETPATLSADVKDVVKHLKTRKRKAFTDALKELRQMGLKSNLSRAQLQKQDSLERIIASAASLDAAAATGVVNVDGVQHYFVRVLEALMKVRGIKETSPDLQGNDTARVTGFMEHLLSINLQQRASLSSALQDLEKTHRCMEEYRELADVTEPTAPLHRAAPASFADALRKLRWLPKLLEFTMDLLRVRAEFEAAAVEPVLERALTEWTQRATELAGKLGQEKLVHGCIWKGSTKILVEEAVAFLDDIQTRVTGLLSQHAEIRYAFAPLLGWVSTAASLPLGQSTATATATVQELDESLQTLSDSIFVSLQKLKEAQAAYPNAASDAGWLLTYQFAAASSLKALYMRSVTHKMSGVITQASQLQPEFRGVKAVFASYLPVVQEYVNTCQRALQQVATAHRALSKASYVLCTTAATLLAKGFCEPAEQGDQGGQSDGKLEAGTGLGEGEGAEDISKDIKDDEDISELAQEKDKEQREKEIEDEEDAVDMGEEGMEGEMGDKEQKEGDEEKENDEEGEDEDMEEETGDVDDLDPTAVDEKMWDEKADDDDKEKEGDTGKGKQNKSDELEAKKEEEQKQKQGETGEQGDQGEEDEDGSEDEGGAEQEDDVRQQETEGMDEHVPEVDTLDLPEEMQLDGDGESEDEKDGGDEDMEDALDDLPDNEPEKDEGKGEEEKYPELDAPEEPELGAPEEKIGEDEDEDMGEEQGDGAQDDAENPEEPKPEDQDDNMLTQKPEDTAKESDETAPSELQGVQGGSDNQEKADQAFAQQESGEESKTDDPQQGQGTETNESTTQNQEVGAASALDTDPAQEQQKPQEEPSEEEQSFRKVGDILEMWHRQRKQILDASEEDKDRPQLDNMEIADPEFEHLPNEETEADTQALGAATEEQAHGLDDSMAIDSGVKELQEAFEDDDEAKKAEAEKPAEPIEHDGAKAGEETEDQASRAGAMIGERMDGSHRERQAQSEDKMEIDDAAEEPVDLDAEIVAPSDALLSRPHSEARELWQRYESATRTLSAGLCEQLRLILEPTQATKMRGDFRTGKRLNMRRIIPYIASSYKKDKIWMRRAKPSKRQYQVILAVDDSKSMAEGASSDLALETVALVAKALSSLEVGQISVLSFGEHTHVVHPFDKPFTSDSGVEAFSRFTFAQQKTDIRRLVETSLSLFSTARSQAAASPTELWQLEIIISDGVCEEHDTLRRLVRRAQEQRVMIVFVVVDSVRENSILQLNRIQFVDGEIRSERYLDSFPFGYYLVVSDVRELPSVLAGALRQWFVESVEAGA
ncbi:hypothetical protein FN846DRAFT_910245 [Sphaerosporella brunnea]|uniref:Midasin n=1 Tax=Sphaerosporella brunnea TaxID=1250544 RepID=A0A5J5ENH6_9PEZI|nr:hypothetical protein FN846DRAFT_910245 [Sphaerosporella brunnea]